MVQEEAGIENTIGLAIRAEILILVSYHQNNIFAYAALVEFGLGSGRVSVTRKNVGTIQNA